MIKRIFITSFRNLSLHKIFSLINILGLAIGISASLVIYLIVQYDFSFDKFHKDGDRIYRVVSSFEFQNEKFYNSGVSYPLGDVMRNEVTGLEEVAPVCPMNANVKVSVIKPSTNTPTVYKNQKNIVFANGHYFNVFNYKWIAGSPKTSLDQPYRVVLSEASANLYFPGIGANEIIGKQIAFNDTVLTTVTGIVKNFTENTDLTFKTFLSKSTLESARLHSQWKDWNSTSTESQLFVKLAKGTTVVQIQKQLAPIFLKYNKPEPEERNQVPYRLQPLGDVHFNWNYGNYYDNHLAHKPTLYGLLAVGIFLLFLGCVNFINLTTAQASQRAKEIGIRKTMGSSRLQLVTQFLSETFLLTLIASMLSVAITPLLLKVFADFIPDGVSFNLMQQPELLLFLLILILIVSLLAGFYPALMLSRYKPVLVLKNQAYSNTGKTRNLWLRQTLTVSQFTIAQIFIIATLLVSKQINYTLNKELGFKKDGIIYFQTNYFDTVDSKRAVLREKIAGIPGIAMVSLSNDPVASNGTWSSGMKYKEGGKETETHVQLKIVDTNYIKLYGIKLLAGRNVHASDTTKELIINKTYAHTLGFQQPQHVIGKYIEWNESLYPVVGVVSDFHQQSLHEPIRPLVITTLRKRQLTFNIALQSPAAAGPAWKSAIGKIEKAFKEVYPNDDFEYNFQDKTIEMYYKSEQNVSRLLIWSTGLTVFISCLGLLGLAIYITNQRTKEIGIRKVIGATVVQLIALLSKDFIKLIALAFLIAVPIAWWSANKWLQNFAYKTTLSWWIFVAGGSAMILLAFAVLIMRTFSAAAANPVKSLRTE